MTSYRQIAAFLMALALWPAPGRGQETVPPPPVPIEARPGLALDEAIARALDREPSLRAARAEIDVSLGQRAQAALRPSPMTTFDRRVEPGGTDSQTSVGVEWPLDLFRRRGRVAVADRDLDATRLAVADRARLLAAEVRVLYGGAAAAMRDVAVADEVLAAAQRQLDLLRERVDQGATPPLERDRMDVELRRVQAERALVAGRAEVALVQLKQMLGMRPDDALALGETIEDLVASATNRLTGVAPATAIAERPDVRAAAARVALAEAQVDQARLEGRVDVSVFGTYMRMDARFPQMGFGAGGDLERVRGRFNYVVGGATITLPVFNRNQGGVAAAQAARTVADARREATDLAARAELSGALSRDGRARQAVAVYTDGLRELARRNLDVIRQTFDLGRATVSDVLEEQRRVLEVEHAYTAALREAWEARTALTRAMGETR